MKFFSDYPHKNIAEPRNENNNFTEQRSEGEKWILFCVKENIVSVWAKLLVRKKHDKMAECLQIAS